MSQRVHAPAPMRLIDLLPAIYQQDDSPAQPSFLASFLQAFEAVLFGVEKHPDTGNTNAPAPGLEEEILALPSLLDPMRTPEEFLPWLAGWAALGFHPDLSEERRRKLLARIIPLYRIRGTRKYLEDLLNLATDCFVSVSDAEIPGLQIQSYSTVGLDTYVGSGPVHFFSVRLIAPHLDDEQRAIQTSIARGILDHAKPAHTSYKLALISPRMQVGIHSSVGLDTVLGPTA